MGCTELAVPFKREGLVTTVMIDKDDGNDDSSGDVIIYKCE